MSRCKPLKTTLINHRDIAKAFGVSVPSLVRWVERGEFPAPHSCLGSFLLYDRALIEHWLAHGTWPSGTKFHKGKGGGG